MEGLEGRMLGPIKRGKPVACRRGLNHNRFLPRAALPGKVLAGVLLLPVVSPGSPPRHVALWGGMGRAEKDQTGEPEIGWTAAMGG